MPTRFIGLDIHKHYFVAVGVNPARQPVFGPHKISVLQLDAWGRQHLTQDDAVVVEMTTNTYEFYDTLLPYAGSIIAVHPPHVALVSRVPVKTDKKAALALAQLHAAGLLEGVWIPPLEVRELRALVSQRGKMVKLATIAKSRLQATLHRHHLHPPEGFRLYDARMRPWWEALRVGTFEKIRVINDLDTLAFAQKQQALLEASLAEAAAKDERIPLLVQVPGVAMLTAITILAAVGDITRFPTARKLVGYAGLGARVHDSGLTHATGRITKTGRKDLRKALVDAANHAIQHHWHWKQEFERLSFRLGRSKAVVAIARKLLIAVWHVLTYEVADRFADPRDVACSLFKHAYRVRVKNLGGLSAKQFTRRQLDRLKLGQELTVIPWGTKRVLLPPSNLAAQADAEGEEPEGKQKE
ncbi:MAG TPA: IS110 family transposase [Anaerolineales bacterium]